MDITVCGHAGLFIETEQNRILLDPILRNTPLASGGMVHTFARWLDLTHMPAPTALVITHAHFDHFDPESLSRLSPTLPVVIPGDKRLREELRKLGFAKLLVLGPWQSVVQGDLVLTATPSETDVDEFGLMVESNGTTFWHMSDAEIDHAAALRIAVTFGPVDLVSVKYQPSARVLSQFLRSLGACFDKEEVIRSLEAACSCRPRMIFPYAAGVRFCGDYDWFNRYTFPFRTDEITHLLQRRLASEGQAVAAMPGDVFSIRQRGTVVHIPRASKFIKHDPTGGGDPEWEPIDSDTLLGVADHERAELKESLRAFLHGPFASWVSLQRRPDGVLWHFVEFEVKWQLTVHAGGGTRFEFAMDFSDPSPTVLEGRHPYANFFAHVAGKALLRILQKEAGAELLYLCGNTRTYEKILSVKDGKICSPPVQGWELFEQLPEPLTFFLRHRYKCSQM